MFTVSLTKTTIAQQTFAKLSFQKDTMVVEDIKRIQKNIFTITSIIPQHLKIIFSTSDTDKINIAFTKIIDTTIQPNNPLYLSVYYKLLERSNKEWSSIQANVYSSEGKLLQQSSFTIHLFKISRWIASSITAKYFISSTVDTKEITVRLYNQGNVNETIKATILPSAYSKKIIAEWSDSVTLSPNKNIDWLLNVPVKYLIQKGERKATPVIVISAVDGRTVKLPVNILIPSNIYTKTFRANSEDLYIQTETNRTWRNNNTQTRLGIIGKIRLDSTSHIDLQYRNFSFMQYAALPTSFASIAYQSKEASLYVGNLIETNDFFIDGFGLRFKRNFSSSDFGFTLAKSRIKDAYYTNWQWRHQVLYKNLFAAAQISTYADVENGTQSTIPQLQLQWNDSNKTSIKFFIGGSREHFQKTKLDTTLFSNMQGYCFSTRWKQVTIQSSLLHYSKNYAGGNKGLDQHNHSILFQQKPFSVRVFYTSNDRSFLYANDSAMYLLQGVASNEAGVSVAWAHRQFFWQFQPSVFTQYANDALDIRSNIYKITYSGRWYHGRNSIALSGNIGVNAITKQYTTHTYVHSIKADMINNDIHLAFEWNKGPYFYYDAKKYIDNPINTSNVYVTLQKAWNFHTTNFSMSSIISFQSSKSTGNNNFVLSHQMQYTSTRWNADISLLAQCNTVFTSGNSVEITIRKRWTNDIKSLFRNKKRITLYQDKNGNGRFDDNETLLANKPVWINEQLLMTNAKGQVTIKHSDIPSYSINLNDIESSAEWTPKDGYEQQIVADKNIDIAFQANGTIKGHLEVIKPKFTIGSIQLDGIKIYIQNEFNHFIAVTDGDGDFEMPIPKGAYTITVDASTLGENLATTIIPQPFTINPQQTTNVSITLQQKERAIKIKQQ